MGQFRDGALKVQVGKGPPEVEGGGSADLTLGHRLRVRGASRVGTGGVGQASHRRHGRRTARDENRPTVGGVDALRPWISRSLVAYALVAIVLAAAGWRLTGARAGAGQPDSSPPVQQETRPPATLRLTVHVAGAVKRPGIYRLGAGARVHHALRAAGGPAPGAVTDLINLAAPLQDGQQVVLPAEGAAAAEGGPLSLSQATADQLEDLDGIGPALAARIIEWRRRSGGFASVDQLSEVSGIGPTRLEALRPQVAP
jgi:competence protein ComEA